MNICFVFKGSKLFLFLFVVFGAVWANYVSSTIEYVADDIILAPKSSVCI